MKVSSTKHKILGSYFKYLEYVPPLSCIKSDTSLISFHQSDLLFLLDAQTFFFNSKKFYLIYLIVGPFSQLSLTLSFIFFLCKMRMTTVFACSESGFED